MNSCGGIASTPSCIVMFFTKSSAYWPSTRRYVMLRHGNVIVQSLITFSGSIGSGPWRCTCVHWLQIISLTENKLEKPLKKTTKLKRTDRRTSSTVSFVEFVAVS